MSSQTWQQVAIVMTTVLSITSILIVTVVVAHIDGAVVAAGLSLIAGLGGFELGKRQATKDQG